MIDSYRALKLVGRYTLNTTTLDGFVKGTSGPVVRLHMDHVFTAMKALNVYTGPALDQLEGHVTTRWAATPDRARVGEVDRQAKGFIRRKETWAFDQAGLPRLTGRPVGLTRLRYLWPFSMVLGIGGMDTLFSYRARFEAAGSPGFEFTRHPGFRRPRYSFRIHDDRISTLLVLSVIWYFDRVVDADPRKTLMSEWQDFLPTR